MALNSSGIFHSGYVCARFLHDFLVLTTCSVQASKVVAGFRVGVQKIQIKAEILAPRPSHGLALQRWGGFEREKKWPCFFVEMNGKHQPLYGDIIFGTQDREYVCYEPYLIWLLGRSSVWTWGIDKPDDWHSIVPEMKF